MSLKRVSKGLGGEMGEFPSVDLVSGVVVVIPFKIKKRERANQHTKIEKRREPTYRKGENEGKNVRSTTFRRCKPSVCITFTLYQ